MMTVLSNTASPSPVLIGRDAEVAALAALVDRAKHAQGQLILISGEAGIGKSRLAAEVKRRARAQGFLVLEAGCFPADRSAPFEPLLDLLGSSQGINLEPIGRELSLLHPGLAPLPAGETTPPREPEQAKRRVFLTLAQFFAGLAAARPVLFMIEDIHWADDATLEFLHALGRRCASHSLLLLLTYRDDEVHPALWNWLAQVNRERLAQELTLTHLSRDDVDEMLRAILGLPRPVHSQTLDAIYRLTEGNPFFVEEILKSLVTDHGALPAAGLWTGEPLTELQVPRSVQAGVQQRVERLSDAARQVLTVAAAAGRRFDFELLQAITGRDEAELLGLMKELMAAQLVVEESAEQFAFRHALTREAIYAGLLLRERKSLHRTIAETMEGLLERAERAGDREPHLAELAAHFYEAGDWEKVMAYAQAAGERARALYAPRVAIEQFSRALKATHHVGAHKRHSCITCAGRRTRPSASSTRRAATSSGPSRPRGKQGMARCSGRPRSTSACSGAVAITNAPASSFAKRSGLLKTSEMPGPAPTASTASATGC